MRRRRNSVNRSSAMIGLKQKRVRQICLALIASCLPVAGAQAAPTTPCIAFADIGKTWIVDSMSILLKVREAGSARYKVLEFKNRLPAGVLERKFQFVRDGAAETDQVCINDRVRALDTAQDSGPIAQIVDVDVRESARLVQRAGRLAARQDDNWANLDRAQSDAFYLSSSIANNPPPSPPQRQP
jgi:hypothetical protein